MFKELVRKNLFGLTTFVQKLLTHEGNLKPERLYAVTNTNNQLSISTGKIYDGQSHYSIGMGAEVCNSFCTLYEMGSFFQSLFLSAIGSVFISEQLIDKLSVLNLSEQENEIKNILLGLSEFQIEKHLSHPKIPIVVCLDTDVDPVRYNKHELWGLDASVHLKRVSGITAEYYNVTTITDEMKNIYWVEEDLYIAEEVKKTKLKLPQIKAFQLQLVFKKFCQQLGCNIYNIPIYYSFLPKEDIIMAGQDYSYLDILVDLQTHEQKKKYRAITGIDQPWIITTSCHNCGQSSKTILSSKILTNDCVKVSCRSKDYTFFNESGQSISLKGCGNISSFPICKSSKEMYDFIKNNDISIHFAARELLYLLKDSSFNPVCFVQGDLGVMKDPITGNIKINELQPKNYGDSREMIGSMLAIRHELLNGDSLLQRYLNATNKLGNYNEIMFGYDGPTQLIDFDVPAHSIPGRYVSDTSALKQLVRGVPIEDLFRKSINLYPFTHSVLQKLKGI
ncbi:MAG TPA: hypothetical protein VKR58_09910 [Aquella sp.]|nr:hypothetical protein [Aquella sp.]